MKEGELHLAATADTLVQMSSQTWRAALSERRARRPSRSVPRHSRGADEALPSEVTRIWSDSQHGVPFPHGCNGRD